MLGQDPRATPKGNLGSRSPRLNPHTWLRPRPAHAARMRPPRCLRHSIRALDTPAISRGAASSSQPPFCGSAPFSASLGHRGDTLSNRGLARYPAAPRRQRVRLHPGPTPAPPPPRGVPPPPRLVRPAAGRPPPRACGSGAARALTTESGRSLTQAERRHSTTTRTS